MTPGQRLTSASALAGPGLLLLYDAGQGKGALVLQLLGFSLLLLASAWLLYPQLRRLAQGTAWLGAALILLLIPGFFLLPLPQLALVLISAISSLLIAGAGSVWREALPPGLAPPRVGLWLALKVLADELVMGYFVTSLKFPKGSQRQRVMDESREALALIRKRGWDQRPAALHPEPAAPESYELTEAGSKGHGYQRLLFNSDFPGLDLPGGARWQSRPQSVRARIFQHEDEQRPWLMCIHGYRMGWLPLDFQLFPPGWLHYKLGFNLIMPILPLHGSRKQGIRSGDGLFDGNLMNLLHAISQGVHDLRCLLAWLRKERQAMDIAVLGYSLGGLHAALLASLETDLRHVVAGIPLVDVPEIMRLNSPRSLMRDFDDQGLYPEVLQELLAAIRPMALAPRLPSEQLGIVAAVADRLVPAEPIQRLSQQWRLDDTLWYEGSHLSVRSETVVRDWLLQQWQSAGLLENRLNPQPQAG